MPRKPKGNPFLPDTRKPAPPLVPVFPRKPSPAPKGK